MSVKGDYRFDFRGGVNRGYSEDVLDSRELYSLANGRLGAKYGAITKRAGCQRIHDTAVASGAQVLGVTQWDSSTVSGQVVVVAGGNLYHINLASDTDFTEISSSLSTSVKPWFAPYTESGSQVLYIADGALRSFDGSSLTTSISGAPAALQIAVYKGRMFALDGSKVVYWAALTDPTYWSSTIGTGADIGKQGGQANVETYDTKALMGLAVNGSSLLLFKPDSIARYTGVSQEDIRIDQETEGVSPTLGCVAPGTIAEFGGDGETDAVFFLSDRGPAIATESGVKLIGAKIEPDIRGSAWQYRNLAVATVNRYRHEIWLYIPEDGETENTQGWCWDYRLNAWAGPWSFPFNVCSASRYQLGDSEESCLLAGYDGFVRDGDVEANGAVDDVLRDGTGGTNVTLTAQPPDLVFGDPGATKTLEGDQFVDADLKTSGSLVVAFAGDGLTAQSTTLAGASSGLKAYDMRPNTVGRRIVMTMTDATDELIDIAGVALTADLQRRLQ